MDNLLEQVGRLSWAGWAWTVLCFSLLYSATRIVYNVFFHPLRDVPGPLMYRASSLAGAYSFVRGTLTMDVLAMHKTYGPVVRIRPNELAFTTPQAMKDIYSSKGVGQKGGAIQGDARELSKLRIFYKPSDRVPDSIIVAPFDKHAQLRKLMAPAFSDKSMREQEPMITGYVNMLIAKLRDRAATSATVNLNKWYNWTTFDVIGDLAFGESFHCLETEKDHAAITLFANSPNLSAIPITLRYLGLDLVAPLALLALGPAAIGFFKHAKEKMKRRMELGSTRADLIEPFIEKKNEGVLTYNDVQANANLFIFAGSETTASLLAGVTYLLLVNPDKLARLTDEIRSAFKTEDEINTKSVQNLTYMLACLGEALRYYPPAPTGFPRVVPAGGAVIDGLYIPEGTVASVHMFASHHYKANWVEPDEYAPERFLGDDRFAADKKDALRPFSVGHRDCVGKTLAYAEMRLILARMIWNFDMELSEDSKNWLKGQKAFAVWKKPPLNVQLKLAAR